MINLIEKLLNLIYIQPCYLCKSTKEDTILCSKCREKIHYLPKTVIRKIDGVSVYSCTVYDDVIKKLIKNLKYHNQKQLAKVMALIMHEYIKELNLNKEYVLLPVPIHKNRLKERKYNHMEICANEIFKLSGYKVNKNLLIRIKDTQNQYKLHRDERIKNIKGAFELSKTEFPDKTLNYLIIDDITSTGATLEEIIKLLKSNGYNNLTALTLAVPDIWN